jgi:hypothetical protein
LGAWNFNLHPLNGSVTDFYLLAPNSKVDQASEGERLNETKKKSPTRRDL